MDCSNDTQWLLSASVWHFRNYLLFFHFFIPFTKRVSFVLSLFCALSLRCTLVSKHAVSCDSSLTRSTNAAATSKLQKKQSYIFWSGMPTFRESIKSNYMKNVFLAELVRTSLHSCTNEAPKVQPPLSLSTHMLIYKGTLYDPNSIKRNILPMFLNLKWWGSL